MQRPGKAAQFLRGVCRHHTAAGIDDGFFCAEYFIKRPQNLAGIAFEGRFIAPDVDLFGICEIYCLVNNILGKINEHGPRAPGAGDIEGLFNNFGELLDVLYQIIMLGARTGNAHDVGFLKRVIADQRGGHLAGKNNNRY